MSAVVGVFLTIVIFTGAISHVSAAPALTRTSSGKILFDNFNRASLGTAYTAEGGGTGGWSISGNRVQYQSSGSGQAVLRNTAVSIPANAIYEATFNISNWGGVTPRLRASVNGNNYYYYDSHFNSGASLRRFAAGTDTAISETAKTYSANTDYRVKMKTGGASANDFKLWLDDALVGSGTDAAPFAAMGNTALWAADFSGGTSVYYDNLSVYASTDVTVNGTYGSWALYKNDGTTMVGSCNTAPVADYVALTSFPVDYANGSAAQIKVFPVADTTCSGAAVASFVGTPDNEIFGGDVFGYTESTVDTVAPVRSNGAPSGALVSGVTQATLSLTTDENATCRYSNTIGTAYNSMTNSFGVTGTTSHSTLVTGLSDGTSYTYYVRCVDVAGNANGDDFTIGFSIQSPTPTSQFQEQALVTNLTAPLALNFLPDGRMLIAEKGGALKILLPGTTQPEATPVVTLTNLYIGGESGLLNVVADNNFSQNKYIYIFYSAQTPFKDRVSRFTMSGNIADPNSELILWEDNRSDTGLHEHRGGGLAISSDNHLFVSVGDHFTPSLVNDMGTYYGKVLRLNLDGSIPTDNPFYDGAGPNLDAIWAIGLRNPYRMNYDAVSNRLYIGDVGALDWEEINIGIAGANYGWPVCEGNCANPAMTNPFYTYSHNGGQAAVTAGIVYRGTQFPSEYIGSFFYGDYANGWIKRLTLDASGLLTGSLDFLPPTGQSNYIGAVVDLKEGPDGSLYYVDIGTTTGPDGSIKKISYTATNQLPVAVSSANPANGAVAPLLVSFSSAGSFDPEGQPLSYNWNFGDGQSSVEANPQHTYAQSGSYQAVLTVSDGTYSVSSSATVITIGNPPQVAVSSPLQGATFRANDVISYSGTATDTEDGVLPASAYTWTVLFHHDDHIHPFIGPVSGQTSGQFTIPATGHDFRGSTSFEIILAATDSSGIQVTSSVFIFPNKVNLTFSTLPANLNLIIDGITITASRIYDTLIGFQHAIEALNQMNGSTQYTFASWSDGGAQAHVIVVPAVDQLLTATFGAQIQPALTRTSSGKILFDNFNRASLGTAYTAEGGGTGGWSISGNRVQYQSSGSGQAVLRNTAVSIPANAIYEATFNISNWGGVTPRLRASVNGNNYYYYDSHFNSGASLRRFAAGTDTAISETAKTYSANTDYRVKMKTGGASANDFKLWLDDALVGSGTDAAPFAAMGNTALWAADFSGGTSVYYDNLSVYASTDVTVNGTYGSWALYKNDGTTMVGSCNTAPVADYVALTSFPVDYANGSAAQIKVFPVADTTCSGAAVASFVGTPDNEIFGGDVFGLQ